MFGVDVEHLGERRVTMNQNRLRTLDHLNCALRLMDREGVSQVAARIAMAIDELSRSRACLDQPTFT